MIITASMRTDIPASRTEEGFEVVNVAEFLLALG